LLSLQGKKQQIKKQLVFRRPQFEVDMEGKHASWEGVVKVPFVDEVRCRRVNWGL
jgi:5'-3' exonuclease